MDLPHTRLPTHAGHRLDRSVINVHIQRARRQLGEIGVDNPAGLIERRPQSRELRLGVSQIHIERG